jgi:hypothetical protein
VGTQVCSLTLLSGFVMHLTVQMCEAEIYFGIQRGSFRDLRCRLERYLPQQYLGFCILDNILVPCPEVSGSLPDTYPIYLGTWSNR